MSKDTIGNTLEGLFGLQQHGLLYLFLTIFALANIAGQMDEYKLVQGLKIGNFSYLVYLFVWILSEVFQSKSGGIKYY